MMRVDLVPESLKVTRLRRKRIRAWWRVLGAYAALVVIGVIVSHLPSAGVSPRLETELHRLDEAAERASAERVRLAGVVNEQRRRLEAARAVGEHPDWSILLNAVSRARGEKVVIEQIELKAEKIDAAPAGGNAKGKGDKESAKKRLAHAFELIGHSSAPGGVFEFARALEQLGVFDSVTVKSTQAATLGQMPTTRFEVRAMMLEPMEAQP